MRVEYKDIKTIGAAQLEQLFLSVNWSSGQYPEKLQTAMENSHTVVTAWAGDKLVGLVNALSDGIMTAYIHYLLVHPDFQGKGIGKELIEKCKAAYKDYARIAIIAYDERISFYERMGFETGEGKSPMFITSLTT